MQCVRASSGSRHHVLVLGSNASRERVIDVMRELVEILPDTNNQCHHGGCSSFSDLASAMLP